jgi:hypothetical protein
LPQTAIRSTVQRCGRRKTGRPVKFETTDQTRQAVDDYLKAAGKKPSEFLFKGRRGFGRCMTTRLYMHDLFQNGLPALGWTQSFLARIGCGEQRPR